MSGRVSRASGAVYGVVAGVLVVWAGTPIANKIAVTTIDPVTVGILRSVCAGPIAAALALGFGLPFPRSGYQRVLLFISGIASFAIWPSLLSLGLGLTTANHAGLIIALIPVFTGLFAALLERKWPRLGWWTGVSIAVVGTFFLIFYRSGAVTSESTAMTGDLVVLAGVVMCAIGYVAGGKLSPVIGTWSTTFWGLASASILLTPVAVYVADRTDWTAVGKASWLAMVYLALLGTLGGYVAWFWALGRGGIARISSWQLSQPVITLVGAAMFLGESITLPLLASASVIIAGTAFTQMSPRR